jgi:uncharacterized membrane protein YfcA
MLDAQLISIGLGLFVGFILALSGAGGGIFAIPLLVFGLNLSLTQAAPIALLAVMSAASVGAIQGINAGIVRYKTALLMAAFGIAFAPLGVWLAKRTPTQYLSLIFAVILIYVAWRMLQQNTPILNTDEHKPDPACVINPVTSKLFWTALCTRRLVATGSAAGLLSGLLGVGGGFVIVPSLRKVSNFDTQTIIATSLAVIALVSAGSVATYLLHGDIQWTIAVPFVISTMVSMFAFRLISDKIPTKISQRSFAVLAVIAALLLIAKSLALL